MAGFLPFSNPVSQWVDPRRNTLMGLSAGLLDGDMGAAMRYAMQGRGVDQQYALEAKQLAQAEAERNATAEWLKKNYPQFSMLPPSQGFDAAMKQMAQATSGSDERFFGNVVPMEDESGNIVLGQVSNAGNWQPLQGADGMKPAPTTKQVDTGTEIITTDIYGNELYRTPKQVREAAAQEAGGKVEGANQAERAIQAPIQQANMQRLDAQTDNVIQTIDKATGQVSWDSTGLVGQVLGGVAGTKAFDLRETAKTIKANLGFAELQAMRDASPTGGALGQVAVQELEALQSTLASLNPDQSDQQLLQNLTKVRELLERQKTYRRMASEAKYSPPQSAPAGGGADYKSKYGLE